MLAPCRFRSAMVAVAGLTFVLSAASKLQEQIPGASPGQQLPTPDQARQALQNPALVEQLRQKLQESGLTPDQVRSRLRSAGYPENMLDDYLTGADTTNRIR